MEDAYVLHVSEKKFKDLYLTFCGYAKCEPLHSFGPAVRPNYIIHYVLEGKGRYHVGEDCYDIEAGQGFLIEPEVQTFYQASKEEPWTYLWVGFDGANAREYLREIGLGDSHLLFESQHMAELKSTVISMLKNHTSTTTNEFLLESLLYSFFAILSRDIDVPTLTRQETDNRYVRKAVEYIRNNYSNPIKITDIADYVCISRNYLYSLFRQSMGVSPQDYLTNYRMTRATELLTTTELSVEGVALSCGYRDPLVFTKSFKAKHEMTPSKYRKQNWKDRKDYLEKSQDILEEL